MAKITSNPLTFIDTTDSRKFEVHISSNLPQVQTYDRNNAVYSPDWSDTALNLQASIYLDSTDITANISDNDVEWYKNTISAATKISSGKTLTIDNNALAAEPIITYICQAKYQNLTTGTRIDFTRVDNGINGTDGASAPAVQAQYSVDGSAWTATLNAALHKYVRYSYDGGATWTTAIKMAGEDGTSVVIKGTAYTPDDLTVGEVVRLYSNSSNTTAINTAGLSTGDSYLVSGYLCVYNEDNDNFICTGTIQGPAGNDGESSYVFIRYATDANGAGMSTSPSGKTYIGVYTSNTNTAPTTASVYTWSKFVGDNAKSIILSGDSQVFKVSKSSVYTPTTIKITAQTINTSITTWTYSTNGGQTFINTIPAGVVRNGNVVTITGSALATNSVVVKASDGTVEDVFTVYKAFDGIDGTQGAAGQSASMAYLTNENVTFSANASGQITATAITTNVVAYTGTTKVTPTIGTISGLPTGMTYTIGTAVNNEVPIIFTIANSATLGSVSNNNGSITIPVNGPVYTNLVLTWSKVNSGATGTSASLVDITPSALYFKSTAGKDGTFTPEYIYLYPRFQNVTYNGWQYSTDGGITWTAVTNANGLSVGTYSSVANTLRVSRASDLYTDTITSISFRCNSLTSGVYDTVSVAKIYDVVDLQIGGRNLLTNSGYMENLDGWRSYTSTAPVNDLKLEANDVYGSVLTGTGTAETSRIRVGKYIPYLQKMNRALTFSMIYSASVDATTVTMGGKYSEGDTSGEYGQFYGGTVKRVDLGNGFTYMECPVNLTYTEATRSFFVYIYPRIQTIKIVYCKLEDGSIATEWIPAVEDTNEGIKKVDTRLTDSLAEVKTTTDTITSKVSATETSITTINGKVTDLTNRVSTAEQKITPAAIVSTVRQSTDYTNDLGKKVGTSEIISKINQTAETITISANKIGLLGATNIPDLTADKIKGGTLTLGGSNATTQNGQLLVKNASNVDMVKLNKDGVVVKSGHLAVAEDFQNSRYNWEDDTWTTTTNTSQLDLGDDYIKMGVYTPSGYDGPHMMLNDTGLNFQGVAQGVGSWGSFIGHHWDQLDFVIQDTVRSNISFRGYGDVELANISGDGLYVNGPIAGGITSGNAKQFSNIFVKNFPSQHTGYIAIRLGTITRVANSMITIKGHVTSYQNSTSFEASCYFYNTTSSFFGTIATMSNPDVLKEVYFAEGVSDGCVYLILGGSNSTWSYPTVAIDTLTIGYSGHTAYEWNSGWTATLHSNLSSFKTVTPCARGGMKVTLWSGVAGVGQTLTLHENLRNFKFLTCIIGTATEPYGITMGAFLDDEIAELHFGASFTATNGKANSNVYGAKLTIANGTSVKLVGCGTTEIANLSIRKIVGWR